MNDHGPDRDVRGPNVSIIVPTYNERENLEELVQRLQHALSSDWHWELIIVDDDSPDGTAWTARELARSNSRIRCIQRIGRRGLSSAVVEGMLASSADYLVVMDGDLQHDETVIDSMLTALAEDRCDIAVGTRYAKGGGVGAWDATRAKQSRIANSAARLVLGVELTDPMTGFFAIKRESFEKSVRNLSQLGFKILLDIVVSLPNPPRVEEFAYQFRVRERGDSKLDAPVVWDFLLLLLDKRIGHIVPARFVSFGLVGGSGVFVHLATMQLLFALIPISYVVAHAIGTLTALTSNFLLNNILTFQDRRRTGWGLVTGWLNFALVCSVGMLGNLGVASWLFLQDTVWVVSSIAGILAGVVWNFSVSSFVTWRSIGPIEREVDF